MVYAEQGNSESLKENQVEIKSFPLEAQSRKEIMKYRLNNIFAFCLDFASLRLCAFAGIFFISSYSQTIAPGGPGKDAQWASAGKQAVGTSASLESKIWFTLEGGMLSEVFYPQVDTANVNVLQFLAVDGGG